jgi:hypothetical protein
VQKSFKQTAYVKLANQNLKMATAKGIRTPWMALFQSYNPICIPREIPPYYKMLLKPCVEQPLT